MRKLIRRIIVLGLAASLCLGSASVSYAKTSKTSQKETASSEKADTSHITEGYGFYLENVNSLYGKSIIKDNIMIDTYAECKKVLKKLEKKFKKEHPRYMVENDVLYSTLKAYDKAFFKKKSLCLYAYDVPDAGKTVNIPKFTIENIDGKKSAVLSVTRRNHLGGIDVPMVSYFFVNVKKNKLKDVTDCISRENDAVDSRTETEYLHAWKMGVYFEKSEDCQMVPLFCTFKLFDDYANCIEKNNTVIKTYKQYKKLVLKNKKTANKELLGYTKEFFKKNNLVIYMDAAADTGYTPRAITLTKETQGEKTSLVCTFIQYPYYGGMDDSTEYTYIAEVSKKDVKDVDSYECRELSLFDKLY